MNNLSLLLYFADVSDNLQDLFRVFGAVAALVLVVTGLCAIPMSEDKTADTTWALWRKFLVSSILACFSCFLLSAFLPSKETVYAIAVSETGEAILESETGNKAIQGLNSWLDEQIGNVKEDE